MKKIVKKIMSLTGALCLLLVLLCGQAFADPDGVILTPALEWATGDQSILFGNLQKKPVSIKLFDSSPDSTQPADEPTRSNDNEIPISVDGTPKGHGFMIDGVTYVSIREFGDMLDMPIEVAWDPEASILLATAEGFTLTLDPEAGYMTANDRCFYLPNKAHSVEGTIVVPIREMARCLSVEVEWEAETRSISIITPEDGPAFLTPAEEYYVEEDLYWLSRIIYSESGNQPMEGMMAVGNVVLNRVADPTCPDSIYEVIFDNRYGVQFSVTETGAIYLEPNERSVVAAKLCLEGYKVVGDCLFFVNPKTGSVGWFESTRVHYATIGEHAFYI